MVGQTSTFAPPQGSAHGLRVATGEGVRIAGQVVRSDLAQNLNVDGANVLARGVLPLRDVSGSAYSGSCGWRWDCAGRNR